MFDIEVQNVVSSATLGESFDLEEVHDTLIGSEYNPEKFRGVIFKLSDNVTGLDTSVLIFGSGKMVCTGALEEEDIEETIDYLKDHLSEEGIDVLDDVKFEVQNIVATTNLDTTLNLSAMAISLGLEKIEYEPEQFPGLVYRMNEPDLVLLFFGSGKVVCTGGKELDDIENGVEKVSKELINTGFLPEKNN